jgi:hypothetical protein
VTCHRHLYLKFKQDEKREKEKWKNRGKGKMANVFEIFVGDFIVCVYRDGPGQSSVKGVLKSADDNWLLIDSRGHDILISTAEVVKLKKVDATNGGGSHAG